MPETVGARLVSGDKGKGLDSLAKLFGALVGAFYRIPGTRLLKDLLHGTRLLRHPLHPAVTDVVVGGLTVVAVLDVLYLVQRDSTLWRATDIALLASLASAAVAALSGYSDWSDTHGNERRLGILHGVLMTVITAGYVASFWMRVGGGPREPAVWLALVLFVAMAAIAHLGGELVFGFGTGVNRQAWASLPQKWQRTEVAEGALEDRKPVRAKLKSGLAVLVTKVDGALYAIGEVCTHAGGPLSEGELLGPERCDIKCPWHGSVFSLRTGSVLRGPARRWTSRASSCAPRRMGLSRCDRSHRGPEAALYGSERAFYHLRRGMWATSNGGASMLEAECALARLDPELLAWAAGFFDGEGSTVVHAPRPGYLRLTVSVAQSGGAAPPEVLLRFQRAVLGLGAIGLQRSEDRMWAWRSLSTEEGQAAVAMLWSELGAVKRVQAVQALRAIHAQYANGSVRPRARRRTRPNHDEHLAGSLVRLDPEDRDMAWAAGFLDGEGCFSVPRTAHRKGRPAWHRIRASASQHGEPGVPAEVLVRLRRILGGRIERHGEIDDFRWVVERAELIESIHLRVRRWLGTVKQEQARMVIEIFRGQKRLRGDSDRCARGHPYDHVYVSATGPKRRCNACARLLSRRARARQGVLPRRFRAVARRYTS